MTQHARLSPSSAHRWHRCPGSVREEAKYPESTGEAAIDGTHSHTLLEYCIKLGLLDPLNVVGLQLDDDEGNFIVDSERANRVKVAIDYIRRHVSGNQGQVKVIAEQNVDPRFLIGRDDMTGTVDVQILTQWLDDHYTLEIIDYKDGMSPIPAKDNEQLEQYVLGVLAELKVPVTAVTMTIIQPKLALKGMEPISSHTVGMDYIGVIIQRFKDQAKATDDPDAPLIPGDTQCKWCRAKGGCSALANNVMKEVGLMFQPINSNVLDIAQQSANKDPNQMSNDQIREILEAAPLMRQLLEAVDAEAMRRAMSGVAIPGFKLVNGKGSRKWALPEDQIADKLIKMGVPKSSVFETSMVSVAKAEKLVWEKTVKGETVKKQLTDRQLKLLEQEYVVKLAGKPTLVPESDHRPAIVLDASPMFSAIAEPVSESLPSWLT